MSGINEHIVHAENNKINEMKTTMDDNINAYDKILQEIYNYNKYMDLSFSGAGDYQGNFNNNYHDDDTTLADLSGLLQQNSEYQKQLLTVLDKEAQSASKSYNKSADMYRNQKFVEDVVSEKLDSVKKNYGELFDGLSNTKRNIEINNYYYKKNKVQIRILYYLIALCAIIYILGYLNKNYNFVFNDNLYVLCVGILIGIFTIYLCYAFYDIYLRDDHNFDEYKTFWKTRVGDVSGAVDIPNEFKNNYDFSLCDANYSKMNEYKTE